LMLPTGHWFGREADNRCNQASMTIPSSESGVTADRADREATMRADPEERNDDRVRYLS